MSGINLGDNNAKMYLGDTLITGGEIPAFNGYVLAPSAGVIIPYTIDDFNPNNSFEITGVFYLGSNVNKRFALCGTGYRSDNQFYSYPSVEVTVGSDSKVWVGLTSNEREWDLLNQNITTAFTANSYHYIKLSFDSVTKKLVLSHSTDGNTWDTLFTTTISGTIYNTTYNYFCFGCNGGNSSNLLIDSTANLHLAIDKCKLVSNGNILFGYDN